MRWRQYDLSLLVAGYSRADQHGLCRGRSPGP